MKKALEYHNKALAIDVNSNEKNDPIAGIDCGNIGIAFKMINNYDEAIQNLNEALEIYNKFDQNQVGDMLFHIVMI